MRNPKFLYASFYGFDNFALMRFIEAHGTALKVERGNRVFPVSDHASDIIAACERALREQSVRIRLFCEVTKLSVSDGRCRELAVTNVSNQRTERIPVADAHVIVATGGLSYASTGSTGDGYRFAAAAQHQVTETEPSLVPLETRETWAHELSGLSLRNVSVTLSDGNRALFTDFGELLFTHFGVSGPLILSASAAIPVGCKKELSLTIDLKPALDFKTLDSRILREFEQAPNKSFSNAVAALFPARLRDTMVSLSGIDPAKKVHDVTREERRDFESLIKSLPLSITKKRGWNEAVITRGGIEVKEIDPSTMRSKKADNLSFCGEVLDLDALTGGFNLQIAFSTGHLAGDSIVS